MQSGFGAFAVAGGAGAACVRGTGFFGGDAPAAGRWAAFATGPDDLATAVNVVEAASGNEFGGGSVKGIDEGGGCAAATGAAAGWSL